jgi:hypothetical protein
MNVPIQSSSHSVQQPFSHCLYQGVAAGWPASVSLCCSLQNLDWPLLHVCAEEVVGALEVEVLGDQAAPDALQRRAMISVQF